MILLYYIKLRPIYICISRGFIILKHIHVAAKSEQVEKQHIVTRI